MLAWPLEEKTAMAQILVRELDESVVKRLKSRAKANGRSMESEIRVILEAAAHVHDDKSRFIKDVERLRKHIGRRRQTDSGILQAEDRER
jgi:plasmid stability protein